MLTLSRAVLVTLLCSPSVQSSGPTTGLKNLCTRLLEQNWKNAKRLLARDSMTVLLVQLTCIILLCKSSDLILWHLLTMSRPLNRFFLA